MAKRSNHYEAALEEYLRQTRIPHVVVDETRRALLQRASLKSMDFIVYSQRKPNLLVDVKGRRFPSGQKTASHKWENWVTRDDIESLLEWERVFGTDFRALFIFAYHVVEQRWLSDMDDPFLFRDRTYAFYGVWTDVYRDEMRLRSSSWQTESLPSAAFRRLRAPLSEFL
jgi:hypothetical protein